MHKVLNAFGLSLYESQAYQCLVQHYQLEAKEIVNKTQIPLSRVYGILDQLGDKGWIKRIEGRPLRFEAIHPAIAFAEKREALISRIDHALEQLVTWWDLNQHQMVKPVEIYIGRDKILAAWKRLSDEAQYQALILLRFVLRGEETRLPHQIQSLVNRGISIRCIIYPDLVPIHQDIIDQIRRLIPIKTGPVPVRALIVDGEVMLMVLPSMTQDQINEELSQGLLIDAPDFISMIKQTMMKTWEQLDSF